MKVQAPDQLLLQLLQICWTLALELNREWQLLGRSADLVDGLSLLLVLIHVGSVNSRCFKGRPRDQWIFDIPSWGILGDACRGQVSE